MIYRLKQIITCGYIYFIIYFYFIDFAVGAPYDGPHGKGAVYIYHGSNAGVRKKYSQVSANLNYFYCIHTTIITA